MTDFYNITNSSNEGNKYIFTTIINAQHPVFQGHFPNNPIVPGVMSLMMVRECVESIIKRKTHFSYIKEIKYIQAIVPDGNELTISVELDGNTIAGEVANSQGANLLKLKATLAD